MQRPGRRELTVSRGDHIIFICFRKQEAHVPTTGLFTYVFLSLLRGWYNNIDFKSTFFKEPSMRKG